MKCWPPFLLVLLILPACSAQIVINEVMPTNSNAWNSEWVELYNTGNQTFVFNGIIGDEQDNDSIANLTILGNSFALIVDDNTNLDNKTGCKAFNISTDFCLEVKAIGGYGLADPGETLFLYNYSGNLIDNYTWTSKPASNNSFGRCPDGGNWSSGLNPTPGTENNCTTPSENAAGDCDLSVSIEITDLIYKYNDEIDYKLKVTDLNCQNTKHNYSIEYWIESLFGSYLKNPYTATYQIGVLCSSTSSHQKKAPEICGSEVYYIEAKITDSGCNDSEPSNDFAKQLFIVKGRSPTSSSCEDDIKESSEQVSSAEAKDLAVKILDAPENATQGQEIEIKINVTSNYDSEKAIELYSYIYEGSALISEGGWTANKQEIILPAKETKTFVLANKIKQDAPPGIHNLRARAKLDDKNSDATQKINILEGENQTQELIEDKAEETKAETKSETEEKEIQGELITGAVVWTSETNRSLSFAMLVFISALLVLVFALLATLWSNKKTYKPKLKPKKHGR